MAGNVSIPILNNINDISFAPCNDVILSDCYTETPSFLGTSGYVIDTKFVKLKSYPLLHIFETIRLTSQLPIRNLHAFSGSGGYDIDHTFNLSWDQGTFVTPIDNTNNNTNNVLSSFKPIPAFSGSGGYDIDNKYETLPNVVQMALITNKTSVPLIEPAFLGIGGYDIDKKYETLPNVVQMSLNNNRTSLPLIEPAFLGTGGYLIDKKYETLPNFVDMALITGKTSVPLIEPAFLGDNGFHINYKYKPNITFKDILNKESYKYYYAFIGSGNYSTKFLIDASDKIIENSDTRYDYTNTLQVYIETHKINNKIGVIKNKNNDVITSSYNEQTNLFNNNVFTITSNELLYDISVNHIYKLGSFDNFYTNFIEYINNFFGIGGFTNQLFSSSNQPPIDISNNNIISYNKAFLSNILSSLTGSIQITDVATMINYCVIANPFNNRDFLIKNKDGFLEGDKFFIKDGITVTFNLDILSHKDTRLNTIIDPSGNQSIPQPIYNYDLCYNNPFNITKTITTDLLIILKDNI